MKKEEIKISGLLVAFVFLFWAPTLRAENGETYVENYVRSEAVSENGSAKAESRIENRSGSGNVKVEGISEANGKKAEIKKEYSSSGSDKQIIESPDGKAKIQTDVRIENESSGMIENLEAEDPLEKQKEFSRFGRWENFWKERVESWKNWVKNFFD